VTLIQVPEVSAAPAPLELDPPSLAGVAPEPVVMLEAELASEEFALLTHEVVGDDEPLLERSSMELTPSDLPSTESAAVDATDALDWTSWGEAPEPTPFATETMAQLYLRQGLRTEALAVYRQLIEARPDDAGLRAALAAIETPAAVAAPAEQGPTARGVFGALSARRAVPTRPLVDPSAATVLIPSITPSTLTQATLARRPSTPAAADRSSEAPPLDPGSNDAQFQDWLSGRMRT
jgi:hypothetical protein